MRRLWRRLAWSVLVVWAAVSLAFALNVLLPGDPARMVAGPQARPADVARIRAQLGLDRSPLVQYARFWGRLVHFAPVDAAPADHDGCVTVARAGGSALHVSLGKSFQLRRPVIEVLVERVPRTFALALAAIALQIALGAASGTFAALRRGSWLDRFVVGTSLLGVSAPTFLIALALQYVFSRRLRWLPLDGFGATPAEHVRCIVLPALTLGLYGAAYYTRLIRDELIVALGQDWVRTARAKGLAPWRVVAAHGLRNAAIPVATALALDFGALMGGAVITETVFRWPGIGALSVRAMLDRDGPVVCGCVVVTAVAVVAANLAVDLAYAWLDPRVTDPRGPDTR